MQLCVIFFVLIVYCHFIEKIMQKILIIQTAFIGDVILATALIEKLHIHYPQAKIDFLLRNGNETLLAENPLINKVFVWNKTTNKTRNLFKLLFQIRKEKYDFVANCHRFSSSGILTVFSGAKQTAGFRKNPFSFFFSLKYNHSIDNKLHEVERNQQLISSITDVKSSLPKLYCSAIIQQHVIQLVNKPFICIAPASVWHTKQFPATKWAEFIQLLDYKYFVYLLGAKSDIKLCEEIIELSDRKNAEILAGKLNLLETAALMPFAEMNYVNDSAPLHLASATNSAVSAVFCSTTPAFGFGPLSKKSYIIETSEKLDCRPCGLHGKRKCPHNHFNCAMSIDVKKMLPENLQNLEPSGNQVNSILSRLEFE